MTLMLEREPEIFEGYKEALNELYYDLQVLPDSFDEVMEEAGLHYAPFQISDEALNMKQDVHRLMNRLDQLINLVNNFNEYLEENEEDEDDD